MMQRFLQQIEGLFTWVINQLRTNPLGSFLITVSFLLISWIVRETLRVNNMGFINKTFWDWMELLIIPAVLAISAFLFNRSERKSEQKIASERFQEEVLQEYLDRMTELLLEKGLLTSEPESEVRVAARAQTLTTFRILDGKRKGVILKFLSDAKLIEKEAPKVFLEGSDISEADLVGATLYETALYKANMQRADLSHALLCKSWLVETDLREAILSEADLRSVNLSGANLSKAILHKALLVDAILIDADLTKANLSMADVTEDQLSQAKSLTGAIMPNNKVHK